MPCKLHFPAYHGRLLEDDDYARQAIADFVQGLGVGSFPDRVTEAWSPEDLAAYRSKISNLARSAIATDEATTRKAIQLLNQTREGIVLELAQVDPKRFKAFTLPELKGAIDDRLESLNGRLTGLLGESVGEGAITGAENASELLSTLGYDVPVTGISEELVRTAQGFSADLITNMTDDLRGKITSTLNRSVLAGESPGETITKIGRNLKDPSIFGNTRKRAETIFRTETARIQGISGQAQLEKSTDDVPELRKYWVAIKGPRTRKTHLDAGNIYAPGGSVGPIPVKDPYVVGSDNLMYPGDPAGSAKETINCRCASVPFVPEPNVPEAEKKKAAKKTPTGAPSTEYNRKAQDELDAFGDRRRTERNEFGTIIDKNGEVMLPRDHTSGSDHSITWDAHQLRLSRGRIVTHSHPEGRSFSKADIRNQMYYDQLVKVAQGEPSQWGTYDYYMEWTDAGKALDSRTKDRIAGTIGRQFNNSRNRVRPRVIQDISDGVYSGDAEATFHFPDRIWRDVLRPRTQLGKFLKYRRVKIL